MLFTFAENSQYCSAEEFYSKFANLVWNRLENRQTMCGIFGFALKKPVSMAKVSEVLEKLEVHQYPQEPRPVGGYGAGVAILADDDNVVLNKVGKICDFPSKCLSETIRIREACVLIGHVRMPSPQFMETAKFNETAQPYMARCHSDLTVISAHNGSVANYREIRDKLGKAHIFESEKVELIDSEVIPHAFEELLQQTQNAEEALYALFCVLQGPSAIALLQLNKDNAFLHFIHKGKTRGLTIWTNNAGELVFCSRKEPLMEVLGNILNDGMFREKTSVAYHEDVGLKLCFQLHLR